MAGSIATAITSMSALHPRAMLTHDKIERDGLFLSTCSLIEKMVEMIFYLSLSIECTVGPVRRCASLTMHVGGRVPCVTCLFFDDL